MCSTSYRASRQGQVSLIRKLFLTNWLIAWPRPLCNLALMWSTRMPTPMIDDIELKAVQYIRQETDQDYVRQKVPALSGTLHQKLGRRSHRVVLTGYLLPATASDDLKKLQEKAAAGEEVTFTADITTALSIDKMVMESFRAEQQV